MPWPCEARNEHRGVTETGGTSVPTFPRSPFVPSFPFPDASKKGSRLFRSASKKTASYSSSCVMASMMAAAVFWIRSSEAASVSVSPS